MRHLYSPLLEYLIYVLTVEKCLRLVKGEITPIPKNSTSNPTDPMMYHGITLVHVTYNLNCGILNARLTEKLNNIGF